MKISEIPKYLWSKHPYLTASALLFLAISAIGAATFFALGFPLVIPISIIISAVAIVLIGTVATLIRYRSSKPKILPPSPPYKISEPPSKIPPEILNSLTEKQQNDFRQIQKQYGNNILMWAVSRNYTAIVDKILNEDHFSLDEKMALINQKNAQLDTVLLWAAKAGYTESVDMMLNIKGMLPSSKWQLLNQQDPNGESPIRLAIYMGRSPVVQSILNLNDITSIEKFNLLSSAGKSGNTALMYAVIRGYSNIVRLILEAKNLSAEQKIQLFKQKDLNGNTPLMLAINHDDLNKSIPLMTAHTNVIKAILNSTSIPPIEKFYLFDQANNKDQTPLMVICQEAYREGYLDAIKGLFNIQEVDLQKKIDILMRKNRFGNTALMSCAFNGRPEVIQVIFSINGITPKQKFDLLSQENNNGRTAFMYAAKEGYLKIIEMILQMPDITVEEKLKLINHSDANGETALSLAAKSGHKDIVRVILDFTPPEERIKLLKHQNNKGNTPLLEATKHRDVGTAEIILKSIPKEELKPIINMYRPAKPNQSAIHIANKKHDLKMLKLLEGFGAELPAKETGSKQKL